jgi:hypothetical protein
MLLSGLIFLELPFSKEGILVQDKYGIINISLKTFIYSYLSLLPSRYFCNINDPSIATTLEWSLSSPPAFRCIFDSTVQS